MTADDEGRIDEEDFRTRLRALLAARTDLSCAGLSRALGRNHAYLQQYLTRRSPRRLPLEDKLALARCAGIAPADLGLAAAFSGRAAGGGLLDDMPVFTGHDLAVLRTWIHRHTDRAGSDRPLTEDASCGEIRARRRSACETLSGWLSASWSRSVFAFRSADNALAPTIRTGDILFVDGSLRRPHDDGIYLCDLGATGVAVRRIFRRGQDRLLLIADNIPAGGASEVPADGLAILGRVVAVFHPLGGDRPPSPSAGRLPES